jgi:hypothetical protein
MELPVDTAASGALPPERDRRTAGEWAIAVTMICSLVLAAGGGYVFYASIRPVSISTGYFAVVGDFPWLLAYLVLAATWVAGPAILLVLGLVHLLRQVRHRWWSAAGWIVALAANVPTGFLIMHGYRLLFSAYPTDSAGEPLGPSRWTPGGPYWLALAAAGGELAVGVILIALVNASPGKLPGGVRLSRDRARRWKALSKRIRQEGQEGHFLDPPGSAAIVEGHLVAVRVRKGESAAERTVDGR